MVLREAFVLCALVFSLGACTHGSGTDDSSEADATPNRIDSTSSEAPAPLTDTSWRLVKIMEMNDTVHRPDDAGRYTLRFGIGGEVSLRIDCNRGKGTWHSENPGQLTFGPIAATRAMCPPDSLHDNFLAQFEWVRSYIIEDGHLYLATMADGAIIEFEPATDP